MKHRFLTTYKNGHYELLDDDGKFSQLIYIHDNQVQYIGYEVYANITSDRDFARFRETVIWEGNIGRFLFENHPNEYVPVL